MKQVLEFLRNSETFYIATDDNGQPRVRPFGAVCEFEGKLYIIMNNQKNIYKQVMQNPRVEICGMYNGEWLRVQSKLQLDERREARVAMLEACPSLKNMYSPDDKLMEVFSLNDSAATFSSFTSAPRSVQF